jgi:hypothetical protein
VIAWAAALLISSARGADIVSLDERRAAKVFAPFVGAYASADEARLATVVVEDGALRVWERDHAATRPTVTVPLELLFGPVESRDGFTRIKRSLEIDDLVIAYDEEIKRAWWSTIRRVRLVRAGPTLTVFVEDEKSRAFGPPERRLEDGRTYVRLSTKALAGADFQARTSVTAACDRALGEEPATK